MDQDRTMATVRGSDLKHTCRYRWNHLESLVAWEYQNLGRHNYKEVVGNHFYSNCFSFPYSSGFLPLDLDRDPGDSGSVTDGGHGGLNGGSSGSVNGANGGGGGGKKKKKKRRHRTIFTSFQVGFLFSIVLSLFF